MHDIISNPKPLHEPMKSLLGTVALVLKIAFEIDCNVTQRCKNKVFPKISDLFQVFSNAPFNEYRKDKNFIV